MLRVLLLLAFNSLAMAVLVALLGHRLVFYPSKHPEGHWEPEGLGTRFQDVTFDTEDNLTLHGWWTPAETEKTLLWCHGNSGNITHRLDLLQFLTEMDLQVLLFDYRGYGRSEGHAHEKGLYRDATAAYRFLCREKDVSPDHLFLFGRSLGGAVATRLASDTPCGGVILQSTFTSIPEMSNASMPIPYLYKLLRAKMNSLSRIDQIDEPTLHIHGDQDSVVPISLGRRLYEHARDPKAWVEFPGAGHDDVKESNPSKYRQLIQKMIDNPSDISSVSQA